MLKRRGATTTAPAVEIDGVGRYERHGRGPAVVILSNPQADPGWWADPFVSALVAAGYQVVPFVHTGASSAPEAVVRDVAKAIEHLGGGAVRLLGWSQGAAIAQEVALARPDLVAAAALIAGYGRQNSIDRVLQEAWAALAAAGHDLDPVRLAMLMLTSHPPQMLGEDSLLDPHLEDLRRVSAKPADDEPRRRSATFIAAYQERLVALSGITVPCLVMGFGQDADTYVARARQVADAIPRSRYVELADAGHLTPVTEPERVIEPTLDFFTDVDAKE